MHVLSRQWTKNSPRVDSMVSHNISIILKKVFFSSIEGKKKNLRRRKTHWDQSFTSSSGHPSLLFPCLAPVSSALIPTQYKITCSTGFCCTTWPQAKHWALKELRINRLLLLMKWINVAYKEKADYSCGAIHCFDIQISTEWLQFAYPNTELASNYASSFPTQMTHFLDSYWVMNTFVLYSQIQSHNSSSIIPAVVCWY